MGRFKWRHRGSLTVEAVLILPMFMAVVLFISYFIKAHYVHDVIQDALTEAVTDVSAISYPYYLSGALETKGEVDSIASERMDAMKSQFETVQAVLDSVEGVRESAGRRDAIGMGTRALEGKEALVNLNETVRSFNPRALIKTFAAQGASKGLELTEDFVVNGILRAEMGSILSAEGKDIRARMSALGIKGGLEGLDFSGSEIYGDGDLLDVEVQYTLDKMDPFGLVRNIPMKNRAFCRAWMAGASPGGEAAAEAESVEVGAEDAEKDSETVTRTCYILRDSKTSTKYHFDDCPSLREKGDKRKLRTVIPVPVTFVKTETGWEPQEESIEYGGVSFSLCGNCSSGNIRMKDGKSPKSAQQKAKPPNVTSSKQNPGSAVKQNPKITKPIQ